MKLDLNEEKDIKHYLAKELLVDKLPYKYPKAIQKFFSDEKIKDLIHGDGVFYHDANTENKFKDIINNIAIELTATPNIENKIERLQIYTEIIKDGYKQLEEAFFENTSNYALDDGQKQSYKELLYETLKESFTYEYLNGQLRINSEDLKESEEDVFKGLILRGIIFEKDNLSDYDFEGADLTNAAFINMNLNDTNFKNSNLSKLNFYRQNLDGATFNGALWDLNHPPELWGIAENDPDPFKTMAKWYKDMDHYTDMKVKIYYEEPEFVAAMESFRKTFTGLNENQIYSLLNQYPPAKKNFYIKVLDFDPEKDINPDNNLLKVRKKGARLFSTLGKQLSHGTNELFKMLCSDRSKNYYHNYSNWTEGKIGERVYQPVRLEHNRDLVLEQLKSDSLTGENKNTKGQIILPSGNNIKHYTLKSDDYISTLIESIMKDKSIYSYNPELLHERAKELKETLKNENIALIVFNHAGENFKTKINQDTKKLAGSLFYYTNLNKANLSDLDLREARFKNISAQGTNFTGSKLDGAVFSDADLSNVNLSGASLSGTIFNNCKITEAQWENALINEAKFINCTVDFGTSTKPINSGLLKDITTENSIISLNLLNLSDKKQLIFDGLSVINSLMNNSSLKGNIEINKNRVEFIGSTVIIDDPERLLLDFDNDNYIENSHDITNIAHEEIIYPGKYLNSKEHKYNQKTQVPNKYILNDPFFGFSQMKIGYQNPKNTF